MKEAQSEIEVEHGEIKRLLLQVLEELKSLRPPHHPANVEELLYSLYSVFGNDKWATTWALETATDSDPVAVCLRKSIIKCLRPVPSVRRFSLFISGIVETWYGNFRLECLTKHSRYGALYRIVTRD